MENTENETTQSAVITKPRKRNIFRSWWHCIKRYFDFFGRSSRFEYWSFVGVNFLIIAAMLVISMTSVEMGTLSVSICMTFLYSAYNICMIVPSFAVWARRLHDINKSAQWILGIFVFPFFMMMPFGIGVIYIAGLKTCDFPQEIVPAEEIVRSITSCDDAMAVIITCSLLTLFIWLASVVYTIYMFVLLFFRGDEKENRFGEPSLD